MSRRNVPHPATARKPCAGPRGSSRRQRRTQMHRPLRIAAARDAMARDACQQHPNLRLPIECVLAVSRECCGYAGWRPHGLMVRSPKLITAVARRSSKTVSHYGHPFCSSNREGQARCYSGGPVGEERTSFIVAHRETAPLVHEGLSSDFMRTRNSGKCRSPRSKIIFRPATI